MDYLSEDRLSISIKSRPFYFDCVISIGYLTSSSSYGCGYATWWISWKEVSISVIFPRHFTMYVLNVLHPRCPLSSSSNIVEGGGDQRPEERPRGREGDAYLSFGSLMDTQAAAMPLPLYTSARAVALPYAATAAVVSDDSSSFFAPLS